MMININYSISQLYRITIELLKKKIDEDSYIRPFAYNNGTGSRSQTYKNSQDLFICSIPLVNM